MGRALGRAVRRLLDGFQQIRVQLGNLRQALRILDQRLELLKQLQRQRAQVAIAANQGCAITQHVRRPLVLLALLGAQRIQRGLDLATCVRFFLLLLLERVHFLQEVLRRVGQRRVDRLERLVALGKLVLDLLQLPRGGSALVGDLLNRVFVRGLRLGSSLLRYRQARFGRGDLLLERCDGDLRFFLRVEEVGIRLGGLL